MRTLRFLLVSVLLTATVAGLSPTGPAPAAAVGPAISVWTFNACGNSCHHGAVSPITTGIGLIITRARPNAVMLQEMCLNQAQALASQTGYAWDFASAGDLCTVNGQRVPYGNAVLSRTAFTGPRWAWLLPKTIPDSEQRTMICNTTPGLLSDVVLCSTHLSAGNDELINRWGQVAFITHNLFEHPVAHTGTWVIGGDFNAVPTADEIGQIYGEFTEADSRPSCLRCGRPTHNSGLKFDYLWEYDARGGGIWRQSQTSAVPGIGGSDHLLYRSVLAP